MKSKKIEDFSKFIKMKKRVKYKILRSLLRPNLQTWDPHFIQGPVLRPQLTPSAAPTTTLAPKDSSFCRQNPPLLLLLPSSPSHTPTQTRTPLD